MKFFAFGLLTYNPCIQLNCDNDNITLDELNKLINYCNKQAIINQNGIMAMKILYLKKNKLTDEEGIIKFIDETLLQKGTTFLLGVSQNCLKEKVIKKFSLDYQEIQHLNLYMKELQVQLKIISSNKFNEISLVVTHKDHCIYLSLCKTAILFWRNCIFSNIDQNKEWLEGFIKNAAKLRDSDSKESMKHLYCSDNKACFPPRMEIDYRL
ncbi:hypothetical protein RFI_08324 [Reticulomyxa filosa]|uniref:Uncharacterized protein n=1 Tax=Reticulomyxa filosa TaxID=46433 RepID=X6NSS0_RETFI|nr:hypothetical protein RFI_08324 [Reticulomyxa filosa]|eukprot:ETO28804.1 hypothetical protein RFI_08324 [Reticulomyxa filosa]